MKKHPGRTELIPQHRKAIREERFFHGHEDLAAM
jgi:hypothetical protein